MKGQIKKKEQFNTAIKKVFGLARKDYLVTFGIKTSRPDINYGYIKYSTKIDGSELHKVEKFIEKPNLDLAKELIQDKHYLWNSGIFVVKKSIWLNTIKSLRLDIFEATLNAFELNKKVLSLANEIL